MESQPHGPAPWPGPHRVEDHHQDSPDASRLEPFPTFNWDQNLEDDSVDRLASALLDSPTIRGHPNGLASNPIDRAAAQPGFRPSLLPRANNQSNHSFTSASFDNQSHRPLPRNPIFRGNGRTSPTIPRKSSRRKLRDQTHKGISPVKIALTKSKTGVLTPQKSTASRWNAMRGKKQSNLSHLLPSSKTAPLNDFGSPDNASSISPVDVDNKVQAMLAHTKALKPSPKRNSRVSRMSSKFAAKASGAWDRITGKKPAQNASIRYKISLPLELNQEPRRVPTIRLVNNASCMFHSEAASFHDQKVFSTPRNQQLFIANSKQTSPAVDKSGTAHLLRTPTTSDPEHGRRSNCDSSAGYLVAEDPFVDDNDFSQDLDGVLPELPLAASTPRAGRRVVPHPDSSPLLRKAHAVQSNNSSSDDMSMSALPRMRLPKNHPLSISNSSPLQLSHPGFMRKKHPSPTKEDLDILSKNLQLLGVRPKSKEIDELAYSYLTATPDHNRIRATGSNLLASDKLTPLSSSRMSRIPGPVGSTRSAIRFGAYKIPSGANSSEIDELA